MSLDKSKVLKGHDIVLNEFITLKQPKIGEIIDFGEDKFFSTFYNICRIPSDIKSVLWDVGIDFMKMTDWELFINLSRNVSKDDTFLILGDIDLSKMNLANNDDGEIVLFDENIIITEQMYLEFIDYIREMIGYILKREKAMNKVTKMAMIEEDRINRNNPRHTNNDSFLYSAIISLVNTEEFSYNYETVMDITLYQLMKSYYQIINKKSACALYQGSMSGMIDTSKIDKSAFQWIYTNDKKS